MPACLSPLYPVSLFKGGSRRHFARRPAHSQGRSCAVLLTHREHLARQGAKHRDRAHVFSGNPGEPSTLFVASVKTRHTFSGHSGFTGTQTMLDGISNKKPAKLDSMEKSLG